MGAYVQSSELDRAMAELADRQHGILDVVDLHALGASRTQIVRRQQASRLVHMYRGVYALGHRRLTPRGYWLAAVKAIGPNAALSHQHGAALHDLRRAPEGRINVTVLTRYARRQRKGIRVHSTRDLPPDHTTIVDGIPVTTVERTIVDLVPVVSRGVLIRLLEAAQQRGVLDVPRLLDVATGRPGETLLREPTSRPLGLTRSEFEAAFLALLDLHGLPRPRTNTIVHGFEVDAYWPEHALAVELDSELFHLTPRAFETDRRRDAELHRHGIATLRFTEDQVKNRGGWIAATLRPTLRPG